MTIENFQFRLQIMGEDAVPDSLPSQVTKEALLRYIRQRWQDPFIQREMVRYFAKFPGNTLNQMVGRLDEIAAGLEAKRDESQGRTPRGDQGRQG